MWEPKFLLLVVVPIASIVWTSVLWRRTEARKYGVDVPAKAIAWSRAVFRVGFGLLILIAVVWLIIGLAANFSALMG